MLGEFVNTDSLLLWDLPLKLPFASKYWDEQIYEALHPH